MYLERVRIAGIRGFTGSRAVDLPFGLPGVRDPAAKFPGLTVVAGRNGAGKSTFLRSIAAALAGPNVTYLLTENDREWVTHGQTRGTVDLDLVGSAGSPGLSPGQDSARLIWRPTQGSRSRPQAAASTTGRGRNTEPPMWSPRPTGWFCAGYGPFRRLAGTAGEVTRLMAGDFAVNRFATLFREEASLAETVQWLLQVNYRAQSGQPGFAEVGDLVLALLNDGLLPDGYQADRVDPDGLWLRAPGGTAQRLDEMSDGYRTVTALVTDIVRQIHECFEGNIPRQPGSSVRIAAAGVVLIDEIDAHLHVTWQKAIGPWLREHFPQIQFIVTTHSPYVCQGASPGGLIRLSGPGEDRPPQVVGQELYRRVVYGSGDDGVLTDLFGLDSPYSAAADDLRRQLTALEAAALRGHADEAQLAALEHLTEQLLPSPVSRINDTLRDQ